jgi:hypothetical protein
LSAKSAAVALAAVAVAVATSNNNNNYKTQQEGNQQEGKKQINDV